MLRIFLLLSVLLTHFCFAAEEEPRPFDPANMGIPPVESWRTISSVTLMQKDAINGNVNSLVCEVREDQRNKKNVCVFINGIRIVGPDTVDFATAIYKKTLTYEAAEIAYEEAAQQSPLTRKGARYL